MKEYWTIGFSNGCEYLKRPFVSGEIPVTDDFESHVAFVDGHDNLAGSILLHRVNPVERVKVFSGGAPEKNIIHTVKRPHLRNVRMEGWRRQRNYDSSMNSRLSKFAQKTIPIYCEILHVDMSVKYHFLRPNHDKRELIIYYSIRIGKYFIQLLLPKAVRQA